MKKIFFSCLAIAAIASCAKTEPTFTEVDSEIRIAPVTAVATKANQLAAISGTAYPAAEAFDVYAYWATDWSNDTPTPYLTGTSSGVEFVNKGTYWGGTTTYYWPKNGSLRFAAYSPSSLDMTHKYDTDTYTMAEKVYPADDATGETYTSKTYEILVAPTSEDYTAETGASKVAVKFEHALSWLNFKLQSTEVAKGAFTVNKVVVNKVANKGSLVAAMPAKTWTLADATVDVVVYDNATTPTTVNAEAVKVENVENGLLVLPQAPTTVTVYYTQNELSHTDAEGNEVVDSPALSGQVIEVPLTLDEVDGTWEPGKKYTYTILFDLDEILINPTVEDWEVEKEVVVNSSPVKVATSAELVAAVAEGKDVVLEQNITLDKPVIVEPVATKAGEATVEVTIDLNGKDINAPLFAESNGAVNEGTTDSYAFWVKEGAKLTINGNGNVTTQACTYSIAVWAQGGEVVINGGTYANAGNGSDLIYASAGGKVAIYGGEFKACKSNHTEDGTLEDYSALNLKNNGADGCDIVVYGGKFYNFDPANNKSENPAKNFCAAGYGSYELEAGVWTVAKTTDKIEVASNAALEDVAAQGGNAVLTADLTLSAQELNVAEGKTVTLDLGGKTLTVAALDPIKNNGTMTIANGKITAGAAENTRRCVYNYGTMTIDGVEFVQTYSKKGAAINNEGVMTINDAVVDAVFYSVWTSGADAVTTINGGSFTTTNDVSDKENWAYAIRSLSGSKTVIYDATVVGNHGCVAADTEAEVEVNSGKYNCTATYTGNSDWVFYAKDATLTYDANACELTTANPSGAIWEGCTTVTAK